MVDLERRLRDVAAWVQDTTPQLVELMLARIRTEVPAYVDPRDPAFSDTARASIVANLEAVADALQSERERPAQLPPGAVEEALTAARQRIPWALIERTYRIGHAVLWEEVLVEVESWRLDSTERLDLLRVLSHFLFRYVDHVTGGLAEVHQAERDRQIHGRELRRISWVREVLAGVAGSDSGGDYDLARRHLAAVAWGPDGEDAIRHLGRRLGATVLVVPGQGEAAWGWLGATSMAPGWPELAREISVGAGSSLALGAPAAGVAGFRLSHHEALEAARVLRRTGAPLAIYDDVSLEALLLRDERAAQAFVARELGPLLDGDKRTQILLETLGVYVSGGWSAASAGARLGVHERTVGYRVATIEQRLGRPLAARRDELGVALRLHATLGQAFRRPRE